MRSSKARSAAESGRRSPALTSFQSIFSSFDFIWTEFIFKQSHLPRRFAAGAGRELPDCDNWQNAMIQALEPVKNEFHLEKHVDAELRDRHSTETKLYTVRELRNNDLLAKMVNFKDNPNLKDDEKLPLTKTTGWLPVKEI